MTDKKQIPFRYGKDEEKHFESLFKLQWRTQKKNEAIREALKIASELIEKLEKVGFREYGSKYQISDLIDKIDKETIEKLSGLKFIARKMISLSVAETRFNDIIY